MKKILALVPLMMLLTILSDDPVYAFRESGGGSTFGNDPLEVQPYTRRDGTFVQPHHRTRPNDSLFDNYSSKPNVNPFTGKPGTIDPYRPQQRDRYPNDPFRR